MHKIGAAEAIINKGLYVVNPDFVQARKNVKTGQLRGSEIFYLETNSSPIPLTKPGKGYKDPSSTYLDDFIYKNALEQTGDPSILGRVSGFVQLIRPMLEPANIFKLLFLAAIAYQLLKGVMGQA